MPPPPPLLPIAAAAEHLHMTHLPAYPTFLLHPACSPDPGDAEERPQPEGQGLDGAGRSVLRGQAG